MGSFPNTQFRDPGMKESDGLPASTPRQSPSPFLSGEPRRAQSTHPEVSRKELASGQFGVAALLSEQEQSNPDAEQRQLPGYQPDVATGRRAPFERVTEETKIIDRLTSPGYGA